MAGEYETQQISYSLPPEDNIQHLHTPYYMVRADKVGWTWRRARRWTGTGRTGLRLRRWTRAGRTGLRLRRWTRAGGHGSGRGWPRGISHSHHRDGLVQIKGKGKHIIGSHYDSFGHCPKSVTTKGHCIAPFSNHPYTSYSIKDKGCRHA